MRKQWRRTMSLPIIGSKSLVTANKGFTPFFKSIACRELPQHCSHPSCFSKSLTLTESYEAVTLCRVITLLESGERGVAEFANMGWIPQGIKGATLSDMKARKNFLLGKAAHTPGMDRWKQLCGQLEACQQFRRQSFTRGETFQGGRGSCRVVQRYNS